jgi:hypothetical protein
MFEPVTLKAKAISLKVAPGGGGLVAVHRERQQASEHAAGERQSSDSDHEPGQTLAPREPSAQRADLASATTRWRSWC